MLEYYTYTVLKNQALFKPMLKKLKKLCGRHLPSVAHLSR